MSVRVATCVGALAAVAALALVGGASPADGPTRDVRMPGKAYEPDHLDVLLGTTVTWHNDDSSNHTVTADGDAFSSGFVAPGGSFSFTFERQGTFAFHCTIHRFMRGSVTVFGLVLAGPTEPVTLGRQVALTGLAPAGTATVSVRGGGRERAVRPRPDGSFAVGVRAGSPAVFRAFAGRLASRSVVLTVRPSVRAIRAGATVRASTVPDRSGARAVLQRYDRDHFRWLPVTRSRLDASGRAVFPWPVGVERVRVVVRGSAGWADGISPTLREG
jgi:plastocyanin